MAISRVIDRVGQVLGGRYRLLAPIGTGASATVYLSDDVVLRRRVAVKVLHDALADDSQFLKRFRAEAHNAAALNHPHVMAVHDWGQGDVPYLVTELLVGGSLRALLDTGHRLDPAQARQVGLEAARALDYAHRRGLVHRDIKPANLLFDEEGRLRVADFGLARALAEAAWTEPAGAVLGTARYASPEQAQGSALDGRSDVYSLALVLIEAVTGGVPFSADTTLGTLMARVDRPVPVPVDLGPLQAALAAAGVPDPADRPDAGAFITMLMAAGDLGPVAPIPLAGIATLDDVQLDIREPTTLYVAERQVRADFDPEIMLAPPGTTTNGLTIVTEGEAAPAQPATRTVARSGAGAGDPDGSDSDPDAGADGPGGSTEPARPSRRAERRRRRREAPAPLVAAAPQPAPGVPHEVLAADSAPRRRRRWPVVVAVVAVLALLGAGGAVAYANANRTPTHTVTSLAGQTVADATQALTDQGLLVESTGQFSETVAAGLVISQTPAVGTSLKEGETVSLVYSLGPQPVPVPTDLGGHSLDEVTQILADARLKVGEVQQPYDENWAAGTVLYVPEGTPAEMVPGSAVPLVVSAGPAPRTIPAGLTGQTEEAATAELRDLGLKVERTAGYSDYLSAGKVVKATPGEGASVPKGSTVTLLVSLGKAPVPIPATLVGATVADATRALQELGLVVAGVTGNPAERVTGTTPGIGTEVTPGSSVTLVTK